MPLVALSLEPGRARSRRSSAEEFKLGERTLKVPERVHDRTGRRPAAGRPADHRGFDEQGRLYVADSSGSNDNVQKQLAEQPHRIVRLEDTRRRRPVTTSGRSSPTR